MLKGKSILGTLVMVVLMAAALMALTAAAQAMPAQVIIIRHADKFEDRHKIHLSPKGIILAKALSQFFQADPRVLEFGRPAAIIAMSPTPEHRSVRSLQTVEPLALELCLKVINRFTYGQPLEMVNWLKAQREFDGKTVLIAWQHLEIAKIAAALGVTALRPRVWPNETYDRFYLLNLSPQDGRLTSFRNLPQSLLFGDSYQAAALKGLAQPDTATFKQTFVEQLAPKAAPGGQKPAAPVWTFEFAGELHGDFSRFNDDTIPVLRIGGFCFGYYLTTLGYLKKDKQATVQMDEAAGSGSLVYNYQAADRKGAARRYAQVSFTWNKQSLKVAFTAEVDENDLKPEIDVPVEVETEKPEGLIVGAAQCYIAFGDKKYWAPAGLSYRGSGKKSREAEGPEVYQASLECRDGILVFMDPKELMER